MPANTAPTFAIVGDDAQATDGAIEALARLLLDAADREIQEPEK